MKPSLGDQVGALLSQALDAYRDSPRATSWLRGHLDRLAGPLRIAVVGQAKAGKSTLVNAIIGEQVAPLELDRDRPAMTWYQSGPRPRAIIHAADGPPRELPVQRMDRQLLYDADAWPGGHLDRVVVDWPTRTLRGSALLDTPAITAPDQPAGKSTMERIAVEADAVLYLTQHVHGSDIRLLRSLHDHPVAMAHPVSSVLVLSRADELGASRVEALSSARQLARRHRGDIRLRALCQDVIAVTGLLGYAGRTLRDHEAAALATMATAPRAELEQHLLSADRFVGPDFPAPLDAELRRELLDRFGLFGLRLAGTLIRRGFDSPATLSAELVRRSGLAELKSSISRYFTERADVLKARSALIALEVVLRMEPRPAVRTLAAELERTLVSAHDLRELRLLAALHGGHVVLPPELDAEARQLIGGDGASLPARLGIEHEVTEDELRQLILDALHRWRVHLENPVLDSAARSAVATVVRSCEAMLGEQ